MISHIVKNNETIFDIINLYHVNLNEIINNNSHITDFNNLRSGSILNIPLLNEEVEQILDNTEVFAQKYYTEILEEIIPQLEKKDEHLEESFIKKQDDNFGNDGNFENKNEKIDHKEERKEDFRKIAYPGIMPPKKPYKGRR